MFGKKEMRILMVGLDAAGKVETDATLSDLDYFLYRPSGCT